MFDKPNEELKKLEEQLLAAEEKNESFEAFYSDILQEFGPDSAKPKSQEKSSTHKNSTHSSNTHKSGTQKGKTSKKKKKKKSNKGLVITLCLECAGIAGIIAWWLFRLL